MKMKTAHRKLLERIYDCEINDRLPFQGKLKALAELEAAGMIEKMSRVFGAGNAFWSLAKAGGSLKKADALASQSAHDPLRHHRNAEGE